MGFSDPLSDEAKAKVRAMVDQVKALNDNEYYWFHDMLRDLPDLTSCCLRRDSDWNCGCNDYNTPLDE